MLPDQAHPVPLRHFEIRAAEQRHQVFIPVLFRKGRDRAVPQRHTDPVFVALWIDREFPCVFPAPAVHPLVCKRGVLPKHRIAQLLQPGPAEGEADRRPFANISAAEQHTPMDIFNDEDDGDDI